MDGSGQSYEDRTASGSSGTIMRLRTRLARVPILGYALRTLYQLTRLPRIARRVDLIDAALAERERHARELRDGLARLDATVADLARQSASLDAGLRSSVEAARAALASLEARLEALGPLQQRLARTERAASDLRRDLLPGSTVVAPDGGGGPDAERERLDVYYRRLEDRFRGSRDEIRERLRFYAPIVSAVAQGEGGRGASFVDLGCGRGEMVELLRELDIDAHGVDANPAMVAACRERNLPVVEADVLGHLASLEAGSVGGITCIHVLEHLPFRVMLELVAQVYRVLRPGGVAIFETPNPENLIVGACNFHYDPTHLRPLPPEPTRYMLEAAGFTDVAIERLHPGSSPVDVVRAPDDVTRLYLTLMNVPQDYALIAYKAASALP
jgi:O-antigen chain-terminating methyltransferase